MKVVDGNDSVGDESLRLPRPEPAGPTIPSAAEPRPRTGRALLGDHLPAGLGEPRKTNHLGDGTSERSNR